MGFPRRIHGVGEKVNQDLLDPESFPDSMNSLVGRDLDRAPG